MKTIIPLLLICFVVIVPVVHAQDPSSNEPYVGVVFASDFEDGQVSTELGLSGTWGFRQTTIDGVGEAGVLLGVAGAGGSSGIAFRSSPTWENSILEMRIRLTGTGELSLNTRRDITRTDCDTGFFFVVSVPENYNQLGVVDNACSSRWLDRGADTTFPLDEWLTLRMETIDNGAFVYLNDQLILSGTADVNGRGGTLITLKNNMQMEIDSMSVSQVGGMAAELTQYDGSSTDIVTELQSYNMIPLSGGGLLFNEPYVFYTGIGAGIIPLAPRQAYANTVMGGEMAFTARSEDSPEMCGLITRISLTPQRTLGGLLRMEFVSNGGFRLVDVAPDVEPAGMSRPLPLDYTQRHKILVITYDAAVTIYVDGHLVLDRFPVVMRAGFFALAYFGARSSSICEIRNLWVYEFDQ